MKAGAVVLLAGCLIAIVAAWWWLGRPVDMPAAPLAPGQKLTCVSYAPFRGSQTPLDESMHVEPAQIDDDLRRLAAVTDCIRTYSVDQGVDQVTPIAQRHGLKVLQGLWLGRNREKNRLQIDTAVDLARRYPDVITAVVVGNEVLLRGELSAADLAAVIREVKSKVPVPVTYADVWEFWLRNRDIASAVDFVTIHILPYWEDFPIAADKAADHVTSIRRQVAEAFPGKEIMIGEVGWPSAGRMREGALPSPSNQARVLQEVLAHAKQENFRLNVIEAFDQPWKRKQEGTVGGHWGILTAAARTPKFDWGAPVSDHPYWEWQAAAGAALALAMFAAVFLMGTERAAFEASPRIWTGLAINAVVPSVLVGWAIENAPLESLTAIDWARALLLVAVAIAAPLVGSVALVRGIPAPMFASVLGPRGDRPPERLALALGVVLVLLTLLALQTALGLVFDPRYRDFPFAPLTAGAVPFVGLALFGGKASVPAPPETLAGAVLAVSAGYIVVNESFANWQSLWLCAVLLALALILGQPLAARK